MERVLSMKDILNYEGRYAVSTLGEVYSLERKVLNKNGMLQKYPAKTLKADVLRGGYLRVALCKNHKVVKKAVHRLVAEAFIPNPDNKPHINHIDNTPSNNCVSNLEWCTHSENMIHAQVQGRLFKSQSKGGKTRGKTGIKADAISAKLVHSIQGTWEILSIADKKGTKLYFNVKCTNCSFTTTRQKAYLIKAQASRCIKCKERD